LIGVYNIALTEYTVRVFNGVSEVRLPAAAGNIGKIFIVIGSNEDIPCSPFLCL